MAPITHSSYAFAGTGPIDEGNAVALLNDYLPQALGAVLRPTRVPRSNKPLSAVVSWLEAELGQDAVLASDDLVAALAERLEMGDSATLVMLWPEEPSDEEKDLVTTARAADIHVVSLGDAIDDLLWEPEAPAEPATEDGPPWETEAPAAAAAEEPAPGIQGVTPVLAQQLAVVVLSTLEALIRDVARDEFHKLVVANGTRQDAAPAEAPKAEKPAAKAPAAKPGVRGSRAAKTPVEIPDGGEKPAGRGPVAAPKFSGSAAASDSDEPTTAYYVNEDGQYRKAKTRPRRGETRVGLTAAEVAEAVAAGTMTE